MATSSFSYGVCLSISEIRCAADAVPLERALKRLDGVQDASVNPLRSRVWVEVDILPRLERILRLLNGRGYSVDTTEVHITTWIPGFRSFPDLSRELLRLPHVTYCVGTPIGRLELGFACGSGWEQGLREVCSRLCRATVEARMAGSPGPGKG
jgi:copper chaperone CopZ